MSAFVYFICEERLVPGLMWERAILNRCSLPASEIAVNCWAHCGKNNWKVYPRPSLILLYHDVFITDRCIYQILHKRVWHLLTFNHVSLQTWTISLKHNLVLWCIYQILHGVRALANLQLSLQTWTSYPWCWTLSSLINTNFAQRVNLQPLAGCAANMFLFTLYFKCLF